MIWLLLLSSIVAAQEVSTDTATESLYDQVKVSNHGKDIRELKSGRYTQTGKPTFKNGICFGDATCQTTAAVSVSSESVGKVPSAAVTATAAGVCLPGSTRTFTCANAGMTMEVGLSGQAFNNGAAGTASTFQYLWNGALQSLAIIVSAPATNFTFNPSFTDVNLSTGAGGHSACLTVIAGSNTTTTGANNKFWARCR